MKDKAYLEVYNVIKNRIVDKAYRCGERLPSKRNLALEFGYSVITIEHAIELLIDEGYLESKERSGYFVTYQDEDMMFQFPEDNTLVRVQEFQTHYKDEEEFPISLYAKTVRRVLSNYQEYIFERSSNQGSEILRNAISRYLKRSRGISVHSDQIVIGSGAEYLYGLIAQMLTDKRIGIEDPSYEKIEKVYRAHGLEIERLKMGKDGIRSTELERAKVLTLHVTPYSSFPTKITADASKRSQYISWAKDRNGLIIEDDYDSEFSMLGKAEDTLFSLEPKRSVIYLNTFSLTISSAIRMGYMILPEERCDEFMKKIAFYSCTVPLLEQLVLAEIINNGDFERHLNRVRRHRRIKNTRK